MHPYRTPAPSMPSAGPAPAAGSACEPRVADFFGVLLLAGGSLVGIAGMLFADGTLFAAGGLAAVAAMRRARATHTI